MRRPGWRAIVNGREGVEGLVEFEKPVVKVMVEVADERACSSVEGWTVDEYWPGRSTYDVPDELNTAPSRVTLDWPVRHSPALQTVVDWALFTTAAVAAAHRNWRGRRIRIRRIIMKDGVNVVAVAVAVAAVAE